MYRLIFVSLSIVLFSSCSISQPTATTSNNNEHDVVIVGSGISGLTAAVFLAREEVDVQVLEKEMYPGGRTVSGYHQGISYAKGTEYLGKPEWPLNKMINWLDLECVEIPSPLDVMYQNGQFYYGEEGIAKMYGEKAGLDKLNDFIEKVNELEDEFDAVYDMDISDPIFKLDDVTAREWLLENGFTGVFEDRFNVACKGLFGANIDELSILGVMPEVFFDFSGAKPLSEEDFGALRNESSNKGEERTETYSFKKGIAEVPLAAGNYLGERIKYNSEVLEIVPKGEQYIIKYKEGGTAKEMIANKLIIATPAPVTAKIAPQVLPKETVELLQEVEYGQYLTVALFSEEPVWESCFDLGVEEGWFFTDVYDATWIQKSFEPELKDVHIISLYISGKSSKDKSLLSMSDQEILEKCYVDLEKLFPGVKSKITGFDVQRFSYAYPVFTPGYFKRAVKLNEQNKGKVLLAGDYMLYPTFEEAAESGANAAEKIMEE